MSPELLTRIRNDEPVPPKRFQLSVNDMFEGIVLRMIAKRPEDRFESPKALLRDLDRVRGTTGSTREHTSRPNRRKTVIKPLGLPGFVLALLVALPGCGGGESDVDQSTPQAALRSFGKAMSERDWETAFACMDEESQHFFLGMPIMQAQFVVRADKSRKASLDELFDQHGYDEPPTGSGDEGMRKAFANVNRPALFGALIAWHEEGNTTPEGVTRPETKKKGFSVDQYAQFAEIPDFRVEIDGDTAKSQAMGGGNEGVMHFKRIDGKWHYDYATTWKELMKGMMQGPPNKPGPRS